MDNAEQLKLLPDVPRWNAWRKGSPRTVPDLSGAVLSGANLTGSDLSDTDLSGAILSGANLSGADLIGADLIWANLSDADLIRADLIDAVLIGADLSRANLSRANLSGADLSGTNLSEADLSGASLSGAHLVGTNLVGTNLSRTNLSGADLGWSIFGDTDLSETLGLDSVRHRGPSTVGIDTILKSHGKIPNAFLRGAGVPDALIEYIPSLLGAMSPIQFYSCFISYSTANDDFARRLYADLQAQQVRCWFAPEDLKTGDRFDQRIEEAIRVYDKLLVVLSEASLDSDWVRREVKAAMERERRHPDRGDALFPIRLDDAVMDTPSPWAADLRRERHIGDFRTWKDHDSYQAAIARLLKDLATSSAK